MTRVLVVGGGITGLTVARALAGLRPRDEVSIEVREADDRLGGKLRTSPFAGLPAVDEGADAFLARVPHGTALARTVGLGDDLTSPTGATASALMAAGAFPHPAVGKVKGANEKLNVAVFGPGGRAQEHLRHLLRFKEQGKLVDLIALADVWDGNKQVGQKLNAMLELGASKPWPDALEAFTGTREMSGQAMIEYFRPLQAWLTEQNRGKRCGW